MSLRSKAWRAWAALLVLAATTLAQEASAPSATAQLYRRLENARLDPQRVYTVRDVSLDREDLHLSLNEGTLAFTESVDGRITGAFFEGEGEVLLSPPSQVERASLARFTGAAILNEKFSTAYFRFNDDTYEAMLPGLRPKAALPAAPEDAEPGENETAAQFVQRWDPAARTLAAADALRLLVSFTSSPTADRMLHARLSGDHLGTFDVFFDTILSEQISVGQMSYQEGGRFYDVWTTFPMRSRRSAQEAAPELLRISAYKIRARVLASHELEAEAELTARAGASGRRVLVLELSRYLRVRSVSADGQPVEFLQNESLEGSELARRGNDLVAVVLPQPLATGRSLTLRFVYSGAVLSEAGGGLMYVGARGDWYPNLGPAMADFDLEFRYPSTWTLLATGKRVSRDTAGGEQVARWVSEGPIPLAGFNLGQYVSSSAKAGEVEVDTYATHGMESAFPQRKALLVPQPDPRRRREPPPLEVTLPPPDPAAGAHRVAEGAARTIDFLAKHIAPFPYSSLTIAQMPGRSSQGWPGLVFLSSYAFVPASDASRLHADDFDAVLYERLMQAHETAHQWWGDSVLWKSYHDQWIMEGLANYCALLAMEPEHPADFRMVMQKYRQDLASKGQGGLPMKDAGPVTAGTRLASSRFPNGYEVVAYGRSTWLFHMLRHMLRDAASLQGRSRGAHPKEGDEPFFQVLAKLQERFRGRELSSADVQRAFEEALPPTLDFEGRASLDWFFTGWVEGTSLPQLELRDVRFARHGGKNIVTGTILQKDAPDLLVTVVPIYATGGGGKPTLLGQVFADGRETSFRFTAPPGAAKLLLDPYQTVLTRP